MSNASDNVIWPSCNVIDGMRDAQASGDVPDAGVIALEAREDRIGVYFTPVMATPSGRGTMAATLATVHGAATGSRYSTIRAAREALSYHQAVMAQLSA